ncbi:MAG: hypothetical protein K2H47_00425 [Muribaculaceae bacterium]|nr:hypothetical protein [Muribaculaceae bacterium]
MGLLKRVLLSRALGLLSFSTLLFLPDSVSAEVVSKSITKVDFVSPSTSPTEVNIEFLTGDNLNSPAKDNLTSVSASAFYLGSVSTSSTASTLTSSPSTPDNERESIFPQGSVSLETSHFTWGVDIGASIDVTANDQSTFDADVVFGYKNSWIRLVGIGGGIHRSFGSGDNFIPLYVIFRSSFSPQPRLFFLNFKAGYSFNTIGNAATYGDTTASIGLGINLAMSKRFQSHIIIGYGFRHYSSRHQSSMELSSANVSLAQLSIGVNF